MTERPIPTAADVGTYPDPYDVWATPAGTFVRGEFYRGLWGGKVGASALGVADWMWPEWTRQTFDLSSPPHPITLAHLVLLRVLRRGGDAGPPDAARADLEALLGSAVQPWASHGRWAWGLGFPWVSRHGTYGASMPLVTHTPYVMEALLALAHEPSVADRAREVFRGTWAFLESLEVRVDEGPLLALAYGPAVETRVVINANSYAALAYALHATHGAPEHRERAADRAARLARWVAHQQRPSGRWPYYADGAPGNFTDGFHSCIVLKNLGKVAALLPDVGSSLWSCRERGWSFARETLFDDVRQLVYHFADHTLNGPFRWDLYDQAEYLGVLVDRGLLDQGRELLERVTEVFFVHDEWHCRIDVFNRPWGRGFLRWGIAPLWLQRERLFQTATLEGDR